MDEDEDSSLIVCEECCEPIHPDYMYDTSICNDCYELYYR